MGGSHLPQIHTCCRPEHVVATNVASHHHRTRPVVYMLILYSPLSRSAVRAVVEAAVSRRFLGASYSIWSKDANEPDRTSVRLPARSQRSRTNDKPIKAHIYSYNSKMFDPFLPVPPDTSSTRRCRGCWLFAVFFCCFLRLHG